MSRFRPDLEPVRQEALAHPSPREFLGLRPPRRRIYLMGVPPELRMADLSGFPASEQDVANRYT